jgi:hypothetical protein
MADRLLIAGLLRSHQHRQGHQHRRQGQGQGGHPLETLRHPSTAPSAASSGNGPAGRGLWERGPQNNTVGPGGGEGAGEA